MVTKQKILIVDDDNNIAELISLYLTKECFETRIVNDGEQALKEFNTFHPDLILLDLMLPGIDGYQVCREIRHNSDVPPKAKPSIKYLVLNWGQMTILSNRLIPKNWLPVCVQSCVDSKYVSLLAIRMKNVSAFQI